MNQNNHSDVINRQREFYNVKYSIWRRLAAVDYFWEHLAREIIHSLRIQSNKVYLSIGVGDGHLTEYIARSTHATIIGIDVSDYSIQLCKRNKSTTTAYLCADAQRLPFKDDCFDGIIAPAVLHHLSDTSITFHEFKRVLINNERVFSIDPRDYFLRRPFNWIINKLISEDEVQFRNGYLEHHYTQAGFRIVSTKPIYLFAPIFVPLLKRCRFTMPLWLFSLILKVDVLLARSFLRSLSWVVTIVARLEDKG